MIHSYIKIKRKMNNYSYLTRGLFSCILLVGFALSASAQFIDDPLFYYKFEDGSGAFATDSSANIDDGVIVGDTDTTWVDGYTGGGFLFNGVTNIEVPSTGLSSTAGSFSCWVKGYEGRLRTIFSAGDNTDGGGFGPENEFHVHLEGAATDIWAGGEASMVQNVAQNTEFFIYSDPEKGLASAGVPPVNPTVFGDSVWRHLGVTWGGGNVKMYVNGQLLADTTWTPAAPSYNFSVLRVGSMLNGSRGFVGVLDDVQAWDFILSDADMQTVYNQTLTGIFGQEVSAFQVKVYPNPANEQLTIDFSASAGMDAEVSLLNPVGQTLNTTRFVASEGVNSRIMNVSTMAAGMYLVKVVLNGQESFRKVSVK
jgi:hypothetical protein